MERIFCYTVSQSEAQQTIREYLQKRGYSHHILAQIKRTENGILCNGHYAFVTQQLQEGEHLTIRLTEQPPSEHIPAAPVDFSIVYEDEDLLIVNKPANTPVHPSFQNYENTLANGIVWYYAQKGIPFVFRCINRLDRDTSGLLIVAKHALSSSILSSALKKQSAQTLTLPDSIQRTYLAITEGKISVPGTITAPICRKEGSVLERCVDHQNGKPAITCYQPISYRKDLDLSLIALRLKTGRTHQIRVHMGSIGHPLIGDYLYYPRRDLIQRQALHSWKLEFSHPITGESLRFQAPLPPDMKLLFPDPMDNPDNIF